MKPSTVRGALQAAERFKSRVVDQFIEGKSSASALMDLLHRVFPRTAGNSDRFYIGEAQLRTAFNELKEVRFSSAPGHVLGDAFEALIGPKLRGDKGQFFTPRSLVKAMVRVINPPK